MATKKKKKTFEKILLDKLTFSAIVFVFCVIAVLSGTVMLVYGKGDKYRKKYLSQQTYTSNPILYRRGSIKDRRGIDIARSVRVYNLILEPRRILEDEADYREITLNTLAEKFSLELDELNKIVDENPNSGYRIIKKDVSYEEMVEFKDYAEEYNKRDTKNEPDTTKNNKIVGYSFEEHYKREYPAGTVASDIIGFTNSGNVGEWGIEGYYNDKLNGKNGIRYGYFNSNLELEETEIEPKNGLNVVTTINLDAQRITEEIISEYEKKEEPQNVGVIIMNPNNGEIYVMASNKGYDLNNPRDLTKYYKAEEIEKMSESEKIEALNKIWRNYCISDVFEPGSTYKPFTVAAALEEGVVKKKEKFDCNGFEIVADRKIHCVLRTGHGELTLMESLQKSCNDVMMNIVKRLGRKEFFRYQELFNIGSKTGIDLSGETTGITYKEAQLNPVELATSSFGQGVSVTMIQMIAGYASLVNGGIYYRPHLMKELVDDNGEVVFSYEPVIMKKTITRDTSEFINEALYKTVEDGTGFRAKTAGYRVSGKTGTAQKIDDLNGERVRSEKNYVLSFLGSVPANNPEAVIYVVVDEPKVDDQSRSGAASLLAHEIIDKVFKVIGVYEEKEGNIEESKEISEIENTTVESVEE